MKKFLYLFIFCLLLSGSFLSGSWYSERESAKRSASAGHPISQNENAVHRSPTLGKRAISPADTEMAGEEGSADSPSYMPPGTVNITPEKQQIIGVRLGSVERKSLTHTLRILGRVTADETRIYRILAAADGWVLEAFNNPTGSLVKKDEVLASFYSPDVLTAERNYLNWIVGRERGLPSRREILDESGLLVRLTELQFVEALQKLGMGDPQIEEIARTRQIAQKVLIRSPISGFVMARNVSPSQRFEKGNELYRIVDLSRVWIVADLFQNEAQYIRPGAVVGVTLPYEQKAFQATVSTILPQFDAASRTLKVRLEADNPDFGLRPDMFVDVELPVRRPPSISVPVDAILDSGLRKTVFVDRGNGFFEPRKVETGWRAGDRVQIVKGLQSGERIVLSGNFLIDSESRMELAAAGIYGLPSRDPVCGMEVDEKKAKASGRKNEYQGMAYFFCSDGCMKRFEKSPDQYLRKVSEVSSPPGQIPRPIHPKHPGESHD